MPNTSWGAGKLNALAAVQAVSGSTPGADAGPGVDAGPGPGDGGATPTPAPTGTTPAAPTTPASSSGCSQGSSPSPTSWLALGGLGLALAAGLRRARRK